MARLPTCMNERQLRPKVTQITQQPTFEPVAGVEGPGAAGAGGFRGVDLGVRAGGAGVCGVGGACAG